MVDLITLGETMAVMTPRESGPLRYVRDYQLRMAGSEREQCGARSVQAVAYFRNNIDNG